MLRPRIFVLSALLLLVTACSQDTAGIPYAATSTYTPLPSSSLRPSRTAATTPIIPPRPRPLPVTGRQPCDALSPAKLRKWSVQGNPRESDFIDDEFGAPMCHFDLPDTAEEGFATILSSRLGITRFGPGKVNAEVTPISVKGYFAYQLYTPMPDRMDFFCTVTVDVADGQVARVLFAEQSRGSGTPTKPRAGRIANVCRKAAQVAEDVVETLMART